MSEKVEFINYIRTLEAKLQKQILDRNYDKIIDLIDFTFKDHLTQDFFDNFEYKHYPKDFERRGLYPRDILNNLRFKYFMYIKEAKRKLKDKLEYAPPPLPPLPDKSELVDDF